MAGKQITDGSAAMLHDGYDIEAWEGLVSQHPGVLLGTGVLPTAPYLVRDLFLALYGPLPIVQPLVPMRASCAPHQVLLAQLLQTGEFEQTRKAGTVGNAFASGQAAQKIAARWIPELARKLGAMIREREAAERALEAAQAEWDRILDESLEGGDLEAMAGRLGAARRKKAALASRLPVAPVLSLDQEDALRRAGREGVLVAAEETLAEADGMECLLGWGAGQGDGGAAAGDASMEQKIAVARMMAQDEHLKTVLAWAGRWARVAMALQDTKLDRAPEEVVDVEMGADLARVLPAEWGLRNRSHLAFNLKYLEGRLASYHLASTTPRMEGPIEVAIDCSGSMGEAIDGIAKTVLARAAALAIIKIAGRQQRPVRALLFQHAGTLVTMDFDSRPGAPEAVQPTMSRLLDLIGAPYGGGTDYEEWMEAALADVEGSAYDDADVIVLTDGEAEVGAALAHRWNTLRAERGMKCYAVALGGFRAPVLDTLCDAVVGLASLAGDEANVTQRIFDL